MSLTRRQREILDYLRQHISAFGYAPSLEEIARHFRLSSVATVHKHLSNLERKGLIRREWNRSRSVEVVEETASQGVPLLGRIAAGRPIEPIADAEAISIPPDMLGRGRTYVLQVNGDSMVDEGIRDGDYVIVEERREARNGEMVVALLHGGEGVTLKKYHREGRRIRLEPANPLMRPITVNEEEIIIQGVVIGLLRKYRGG